VKHGFACRSMGCWFPTDSIADDFTQLNEKFIKARRDYEALLESSMAHPPQRTYQQYAPPQPAYPAPSGPSYPPSGPPQHDPQRFYTPAPAGKLPTARAKALFTLTRRRRVPEFFSLAQLPSAGTRDSGTFLCCRRRNSLDKRTNPDSSTVISPQACRGASITSAPFDRQGPCPYQYLTASPAGHPVHCLLTAAEPTAHEHVWSSGACHVGV
jgi:hypothetical protein